VRVTAPLLVQLEWTRLGTTPRPNRLFTLLVASVASVAAAILTSQLWDAGVVGTAAITPVVVALVKDVFRPLTREPPDPAPERRRVRIRAGWIVATILIGLLAFVVAALALTIPEVAADKSITGDAGHTTYFGDNSDKPWGQGRTWADCFDDLRACIEDIVEANR
jgi:uncharacterized membrane protein YvlD (DUF360 family)